MPGVGVFVSAGGSPAGGSPSAFGIVSAETITAKLIELTFSSTVYVNGSGGFQTKANGVQTNNEGDIGIDSGGDGTTNWVRIWTTNNVGSAGQTLSVSFDEKFFTEDAFATIPYPAAVDFVITNTIP